MTRLDSKKRNKKKIIRCIGENLDICSTCERKPKKYGKKHVAQKEQHECMETCDVGYELILLREALEKNSREFLELEKMGVDGVYVSERIHIDEIRGMLKKGRSKEDISERLGIPYYKVKVFLRVNK